MRSTVQDAVYKNLIMRRRPWPLIFFIVLCVSGCIRIVPGQAGSGEKIKILVLSALSSVNIRSSDRGSLEIKKEDGLIKVNGNEKALPLRLLPMGDFIYINNKPFRGSIEISDSKNGLMVVNELNLESYLVGIINNEISSRWPRDVIKSQAVVARTYAVYNKKKRAKSLYHVEGSTMGQVYSGAGKEDPVAQKAVRETKGEILAFSGEAALTVYHSNAGGMTDSSRDVWSRDYPYLKAVKSPYDENCPQFFWDMTLHADDLRGSLRKNGFEIGKPETLDVRETSGAGRAKIIVIQDNEGGSVKISGEDLRKALGYNELKSTIFEVSKAGDLFVFKGKGSGHGVGLSQWGAKGMAEDGYSYREILKHYYPGTDLVKMY
ncbi:MAG: SpoIID/LytB domain-containing protein [Deltaproteobacteria bacterium]|nr:SpoIID/LytB domain-containing protein [Deltaproteobacteria bacterium]